MKVGYLLLYVAPYPQGSGLVLHLLRGEECAWNTCVLRPDRGAHVRLGGLARISGGQRRRARRYARATQRLQTDQLVLVVDAHSILHRDQSSPEQVAHLRPTSPPPQTNKIHGRVSSITTQYPTNNTTAIQRRQRMQSYPTARRADVRSTQGDTAAAADSSSSTLQQLRGIPPSGIEFVVIGFRKDRIDCLWKERPTPLFCLRMSLPPTPHRSGIAS